MTERSGEERRQIVIDADTKAKIEVLVAGRIEDKQLIHELAGDVKEMAKNVSTMAIAMTEQTKNNEHLTQRVERVEDKIYGDDGLERRTRSLENSQTGDGVRWKILAGGIAAFITVGGSIVAVLAAFLQPVADVLREILEVIKSL